MPTWGSPTNKKGKIVIPMGLWNNYLYSIIICFITFSFMFVSIFLSCLPVYKLLSTEASEYFTFAFLEAVGAAETWRYHNYLHLDQHTDQRCILHPEGGGRLPDQCSHPGDESGTGHQVRYSSDIPAEQELPADLCFLGQAGPR